MTGRLRIDLEALTANYERFRSVRAPGAETGAVVKANGYGIGMEAAAQRLAAAGCRAFFVATLEEAVALEAALGEAAKPSPEIFFFEGVNADDAPVAARHGLIPVLNDLEQVAAWEPFRAQPAALHVDTGMTRLGLPAEHVLAGEAESASELNLTLLMSHFACADAPEHPMNVRQVERFAEVTARFPGLRTSLGNSAACLSGTERHGQLGRPGIGLYGGNPFARGPSPVQPVAALEGRIVQIREVPAGTTVGYGASRLLEKPTRIAVVGIGYEDGVPWALSDSGVFAAGAARCPILGRVSMDSTVVDVSAAPDLGVGDWLQCYGDVLCVDEVAAAAGTFAYELLTRAGNRLPRIPAQLAPRAPA